MSVRHVLALAASLAVLPAIAQGAWTALYNGKDLTGWHTERGRMEGWKADGECIVRSGPGGGYLATDREYGDFELRFEFNIGPGVNSGLGIRFPRGGWPSTDAMEIQLIDDTDARYKNLGPLHRMGSIYTHCPPKAAPFKGPNTWNEMYVRCRGPIVEVKINGVEVQNFNLDENLDNVGKGKIGVGRRPRRGLIGFQDHGGSIQFRKIEIREL